MDHRTYKVTRGGLVVWTLDVVFKRQGDMRKYRRLLFGRKAAILEMADHLLDCLVFLKEGKVDSPDAPRYRIYGSLDMEKWQGLSERLG
jgi:hypothetical protein